MFMRLAFLILATMPTLKAHVASDIQCRPAEALKPRSSVQRENTVCLDVSNATATFLPFLIQWCQEMPSSIVMLVLQARAFSSPG